MFWWHNYIRKNDSDAPTACICKRLYACAYKQVVYYPL